MNILLISPATPDTFWSFKHVMRMLSRRAAFPPLGLLTVAAMLPKEWQLKLVDLNVSSLSDADLAWADYVLLSAMLVHADSVRQIVARCRANGKTIVAGGPLFAAGSERFPEVQCVVRGEAEEIMPALVADLSAGRLQPMYQAARRPDLAQTPVPRWDLIRFKHYATMSVQLSRGCPFDCEFCDIVATYGRLPRVKRPQQMIGELEALLAAGWNGSIFIVDDNFIGNKVKVKTLLRELVVWRARRGVAVSFITEASLNLVDDPELLELMVRAGFKKVFIGIETPSEDSLVECSKVQNTRRDLVAAVNRIHQAGLQVLGGFIVGFDSDTRGIFERQRRFIQDAGVVTAMVGLLNALPATRLFDRLKKEGRILRESTGNNLDAILNFVPKLNREVLLDGYRALVKQLYAPQVYYRRALTFLRAYRPRGPRLPHPWQDFLAFVRSLWLLGIRTRGRREYWKYLTKSLLLHPRAFGEAMDLAITGYHFRKVAATL
jgi:radical SAM superfamily enzyme YgiQ (UPF0313 family)